jgi:pimeloyl-ACP methyl ester carboxylesterase
MRWGTVFDVEHAGSTMRVRRHGLEAGRSIVLVHGIGVGPRYFTRLTRVLARSASVHVLELPGFAGTPRPDAPLSVEELGAVVEHYLQAQSLDQPVLVGHSMGGQVVLAAALGSPERVAAVVVIGCVVDPGARTAVQQGYRLLRDMMRETLSANWAVLFDYVRTGPRRYLGTVPTMLAYRTEEAVARLAAPLLILRGARDPISGRGWAEELRRGSPDARLVEIPGGAHVVMYTHPEEVAREILVHAADVAGRAVT